MDREILAAMSEAPNAIDKFAYACERMINSTFIVSEDRIRNILISVAASKRLYTLFTDLFTEFDFPLEMDKSCARGRFILPLDPRVAAPLVLELLYMLDSKEFDLSDFLGEFFLADSVNERYAIFCLEVIRPFEQYVKQLYYEVINTPIEKVFDPETAHNALNAIINFLQSKGESPDEDLKLLMDNVTNSIIDTSPLKRRMAFVSLRHALINKNSSKELSQLLGELKDSLLLE